MRAAYAKWAKQLKTSVAHLGVTLIVVASSLGGSLFLPTISHVAADDSQIACQGNTTDPAATFSAAPTLLTPSNDSTANNGFDFSWSPVTGAASYDWESSLTADANPDGSFVNQLGHHNLADTSINEGDSPQASYYWHVRAVDGSATAGDWSQTWLVNLDNSRSDYLSAPTLVSPSNGVIRNAQAHDFYFTWNAPTTSDDSALTYEFESGHSDTTDPLTGGFTDQPHSDTNLTTPYVFDGGSDTGTYYWHVRATTASGEVGPWSASWAVNITSAAQTNDTTAPTVSLDTDPSGVTYLPAGPINIVGSASDDNPLNCDYDYVIKDAHDHLANDPVADTPIVQWNNQDLDGNYTTPDGAYTITLEAWDASGNYTSTSKNVVIDNTNPVAKIVKPADHNKLQGTVKITGTASDDNLASYTVFVCSPDQDISQCWQTIVPNAMNNHHNRTLAVLDTTQLPNGKYNIILQVLDKSGNAGVDFNTVTIHNTHHHNGGGSTGTGGNGGTTGSGDSSDTGNGTTATMPQTLTIASLTNIAETPDATVADNSVLSASTTNPATTSHTRKHIQLANQTIPVYSNWFARNGLWLILIAMLFSLSGATFAYDRTRKVTANK